MPYFNNRLCSNLKYAKIALLRSIIAFVVLSTLELGGFIMVFSLKDVYIGTHTYWMRLVWMSIFC